VNENRRGEVELDKVIFEQLYRGIQFKLSSICYHHTTTFLLLYSTFITMSYPMGAEKVLLKNSTVGLVKLGDLLSTETQGIGWSQSAGGCAYG
jgi:hypothetical protein